MSNRKQQPPPQQPPKKPILLDATITFHGPKGSDITVQWSAANGDVTHNGNLIHNTNDLALLHTIAKGILAARE
jgi:hypothetical protein